MSCRDPVSHDLSPAELAFRTLLADPHRYAAWATEVRLAWEREHVLWFQGTVNGQPLFTVSRNPAAEEQRFVRRHE